MIGVLAISFIFMKLACPEEEIIFQRLTLPFTQEDIDAEYHALGFDQPLIIQFLIFIKIMFTGDWGSSFKVVMDSDVKEIIFQRLPRTLEITIICYILSTLIGIKMGLFTGSNREKNTDKISRIITYVGISIPPFVLAIFFSQMAAYQNIRIFPAFGYKSSTVGNPPAITNARILDCILTGNWIILGDYLYHLVVPLSAMIVYQLSIIFRHTRSSTIGVYQEEYISTAFAKGCTEKMILNKHVLRNALTPCINMISMGFPQILAGFIVLEVAFDLPGIGQLFAWAFSVGDYAVLIPLIFMLAIIVLIFNLIADIANAIIDPRIKLT